MIQAIASLSLCAALLLGTAVFLSASASAQEATPPDEAESGKRTTIVVEPDGRVIVDGEVVADDDHGVFRLEGPDGDVLLLRRGAHPLREGRTFRRSFGRDGWSDEEWSRGRFAFESDAPRILSHAFEAMAAVPGDLALMAEETMEVVRLEREAHDLARRVRQAEGAEKTRLERELREKLQETFDRKIEARRERLDERERALREERDEIERRQRSSDEIIDRRLNELLGEDDELAW